MQVAEERWQRLWDFSSAAIDQPEAQRRNKDEPGTGPRGITRGMESVLVVDTTATIAE